MPEYTFDDDGFIDLDEYDDTPLGFTDQEEADRILRTAFQAGLTKGWQDTLSPTIDLPDHNDPSVTHAPELTVAADAGDPGRNEFARSVMLARKPRSTALLLAAAAAVVLALIAGVELFTGGTADDEVATPSDRPAQAVPPTPAPSDATSTTESPATTAAKPEVTTTTAAATSVPNDASCEPDAEPVSGGDQLTRTLQCSVVPFTLNGELHDRYNAVKRFEGNGECSESSMTDRADAFRCFTTTSQVLDPCFLSGPNGVLACVGVPWESEITMVDAVTATRPAEAPSGDLTDPWAVELDDGSRCILLTGATGTVGGERINFGCDNETFFLIGSRNLDQPVWTWSAMAFEDDIQVEREVAIAWM